MMNHHHNLKTYKTCNLASRLIFLNIQQQQVQLGISHVAFYFAKPSPTSKRCGKKSKHYLMDAGANHAHLVFRSSTDVSSDDLQLIASPQFLPWESANVKMMKGTGMNHVFCFLPNISVHFYPLYHSACLHLSPLSSHFICLSLDGRSLIFPSACSSASVHRHAQALFVFAYCQSVHFYTRSPLM